VSETVTIGIPTYNRSEQLQTLLESLLKQTYKGIEIIISDNNSSDNTEEVCAQYLDKFNQYTYIKQETNIGSKENFIHLFEICETKYFMWIADDDFIDHNYIKECMNYHQNGNYALVSGVSIYYNNNGKKQFQGKTITLEDTNDSIRAYNFFRETRDNGIFYGIYNKKIVTSLTSFRRPISWGEDIIFLGHVAYQGKILTSDKTSVHRSLDGVSATLEKVVEAKGLHKINVFFPQFTMCLDIYNNFVNIKGITKYQSFMMAYSYLKGSEKNWLLWMIYHASKMILKSSSPRTFNFIRNSVKK